MRGSSSLFDKAPGYQKKKLNWLDDSIAHNAMRCKWVVKVMLVDLCFTDFTISKGKFPKRKGTAHETRLRVFEGLVTFVTFDTFSVQECGTPPLRNFSVCTWKRHGSVWAFMRSFKLMSWGMFGHHNHVSYWVLLEGKRTSHPISLPCSHLLHHAAKIKGRVHVDCELTCDCSRPPGFLVVSKENARCTEPPLTSLCFSEIKYPFNSM